ncbi:MAG: DMT family transporter [Betaproteobacteria bacterium]|nr:MAG: DMT family transporter [Betaproteobacteria bacterium]
MTRSAAARWLLLATLWSLQFIFMRVAVPVFGTAPVAEARALFAACFLLPWALWIARLQLAPLEHWRDYLVVGLANNVLPFLCFAWAATVLPAGYMAVINGTVPLWTAIFSALILHERLRAARVVGFLLGLIGVGMIVNLGPLELSWQILAATAASLTGAALWGWAGVLIKQRYGRLPPMAVAAGSVAFAAAIMLPLWTQAPPLEAWTPVATANMVALGLLCTGFAYLPFFTLIRDIGPWRTLSVGMIVPLLGIFWGWLFLGEAVMLGMLAGATLVLVALVLVMKH